MKCMNEEDFSRYVDTDLDETEHGEFISHIASCPVCRAKLNSMGRMAQIIRKSLTAFRRVTQDTEEMSNLACPPQQELLRYLSHALVPADTERIEMHLQSCDHCTEYLRALARIMTSLEDKTFEAVPKELEATILAKWQIEKNSLATGIRGKSSSGLVVRLAAAGFEILRNTFAPEQLQLSFAAPAPFAGVFRSGEGASSSEPAAMIIAQSHGVDKDLHVELIMRRETELFVGLLVRLSKGNAPFSNVRVSLLRDTALFHSKKTGAEGEVEFSNIPPGPYILKISGELMKWPIEIIDQKVSVR